MLLNLQNTSVACHHVAVACGRRQGLTNDKPLISGFSSAEELRNH
jgi:hypothetical protein